MFFLSGLGHVGRRVHVGWDRLATTPTFDFASHEHHLRPCVGIEKWQQADEAIKRFLLDAASSNKDNDDKPSAKE